MVHDDDFEFEHHSLLQNRANMQNNVLTKRKEQLKDWEFSEVNKMTAARKPVNQAKVKFQDSDIFLSACVSGDEDEVEDLLEKGANINVSTIDGVTALHQAVIDDNLDMVRFLVEHDADIDAQDNEGWTPLHAAVCCGSLSIAKYLCERGADLTLTNSDKELAVDLAENDDIRHYLEEQIRSKNVDVVHCREREFQLMMQDCAEWIRAGRYADRPHPRTGATALHVAASKGYNQLIGMLIRAGANVNAQDNEGWTPLHAAAHWAENDACRILMENGASIDTETFSGQNVLMVADKNITDYLTVLSSATTKRQPLSTNLEIPATTTVANNLAPISRISSASSVSESIVTTTTSSSLSSSPDMQKKNIDSTLIMTPSRVNKVQLPSWLSEFDKASKNNNFNSDQDSTNEGEANNALNGFNTKLVSTTSHNANNVSANSHVGFEKRLLKPTIATSAKISSKVSLGSGGNCTSGTVQSGIQLSLPAVIGNASMSSSFTSMQQPKQVSSAVGRSTATNNMSITSCISPFGSSMCSMSSYTSPTQPSSSRESESERKAKSRLQRHSRRSTQGVTLEHVGEAARYISTSSSSIEDSSSSAAAAAERSRNVSQRKPRYNLSNVGSTNQEQFLSDKMTDERAGMHSSYTSSIANNTSVDTSRYGVPRSAATEGLANSLLTTVSTEGGSFTKWRSHVTSASSMTDGGSDGESSSAVAARSINTSKSGVVTSSTVNGASGPSVSAYFKLPPSRNYVSASSSTSTSSSPHPTGKPPNTAVACPAAALGVASTAKLNRRSQVVRGNRRSTGPVDMEAISVASALSFAERKTSTDESTTATPKRPPKSGSRTFDKTKHESADINNANETVKRDGKDENEEADFSDVQAQNTYKLMYEKAQEENECLRRRLDEVTRQLAKQTSLPNGSVTHSGNGSQGAATAMMDDQERRSFERRIAALEYELEKNKHLQSDYDKLKDENMALIRVLKKLSK